MAALACEGATPRYVGGCVRNALLASGATDIDVAIDVEPTEIIRLLTVAGLRAIPTGVEHGTITTLAEIDGAEYPIEVTALRRDVETDGRRAVVAFTNDWVEDANRRDFTMNALYADSEGWVFDPLGDGLADLEARHVRFIGRAEDRIREDYLRILRYYRFFAWYAQSAPSPEDVAATARLAQGIDTLAKERIGAEMKKLLSAPAPMASLVLMEESGVLGKVLPSCAPAPEMRRRLETLLLLEASAQHHTPPEAPLWMRRLLAIVNLDTLSPSDLMGEFRLSNAEKTALAARYDALAADSLTEAAYRFGAEAAWDAALLREETSNQAAVSIAAGANAVFPLAASDLIVAGVKPGPALGHALKAAEKQWLDQDFALDRAALLELALRNV
ncbi:MAG: CCA tRNA nucleotidyltransferase [Rhodobacteraceae bacterium]|nr:CCA tRNA nucleotidyltransferase [Paracoccaceae bacterium]